MAQTLKITSKGQGIPLVLLHGWGLNSGIWQPLVDKLAPFLQVITVDLPGYGLNSDKTLSPYTLEKISSQIVEAVNQPAIYVGWSLGGLIATQIAKTEQALGQEVLALITIASSPKFTEQEALKGETFWPGIKPTLLGDFHQQLAQDTKKTIDGFLKIQAMGSPHIRQDLKEIKSLIFNYDMPSEKTLSESLNLLETVDLRAELPLLTLPFLRLYGRLDSLVPNTVNELVASLAPTSDSHLFLRASHAPFISHADEFFTVLMQWLVHYFPESTTRKE
jgi:pimeloyl-[acyl-carrier protein] methyl ester esterase